MGIRGLGLLLKLVEVIGGVIRFLKFYSTTARRQDAAAQKQQKSHNIIRQLERTILLCLMRNHSLFKKINQKKLYCFNFKGYFQDFIINIPFLKTHEIRIL